MINVMSRGTGKLKLYLRTSVCSDSVRTCSGNAGEREREREREREPLLDAGARAMVRRRPRRKVSATVRRRALEPR